MSRQFDDPVLINNLINIQLYVLPVDQVMVSPSEGAELREKKRKIDPKGTKYFFLIFKRL